MISEILKIDFEKMRNAELCAARTSLDINIALTFLLIKLEDKILFEGGGQKRPPEKYTRPPCTTC